MARVTCNDYHDCGIPREAPAILNGSVEMSISQSDRIPESRADCDMASREPILDELPEAIAPLREIARRLRIEGEFDFPEAIHQLSEADISALRSVGRVLKADGYFNELIEFVTNKFPMTEFDESAWLYFLLGVMDELDIPFS